MTASAPGPRVAQRSTGLLGDPWVMAALCVGLLLRLARLGAAPLWFDEVMTADWVARPWGQMLAICAADNHPPLYFALVKLVHDVLGGTPWALRLPSALLGATAVPFVSAAAAALTDDRGAARWAAWFAAVSPFLVHHGQEARMYAVVGTLAAVNLWALARFVMGRTSRLGRVFTLTAVALVATHYYTVFYVSGAVLAAVAARPRELRAWFPAAAVASVAATVALLAAALLARHHAGGSYELGWFAFPGALWSLVSGYTLMPDTFALHAEGNRAALRYLPSALVAAPAILLCGGLGLATLDRRGRLAVLLPSAAAVLAPFAIRLVLGVAVNPRYFQSIVPALLVLLAVGAAARGTWQRAGRVAGGVVAMVLVGATALHLAQPGHGREDVRAATAWLDAHVPAAQPLVVTSREMAYLARFHWPDRVVVDHPAPPLVVTDQSGADAAVAGLPWHDGRAVYVFGRAWVSDPRGLLEETVARRLPSCGRFETRGIRIYCVEPREADAGR
jgi:hypothetical protein